MLLLRARAIPDKTAIVVVDMWADHFCKQARVHFDALAGRLNIALGTFRALGVHIIHAPAGAYDHYAKWPQAKATMDIYTLAPAHPFNRRRPQLENMAHIDQRVPSVPWKMEGGCECDPPCDTSGWGYPHELHPGLEIAEADFMAIGPDVEMAERVWSVVCAHGITRLFYTGVAMNMCVLNRHFGMIPMSFFYGVETALIRDLSESFWIGPPFISHEAAYARVVGYIETYIAPTVTSTQLIQALSEAS